MADQRSGEAVFSAEKNALPGDKDIIKDDVGRSVYTIEGVAVVHLMTAQASHVGGGSFGNVNCARGVARDGKADGVLLVLGPEGRIGENDDLVRNGDAGYTGLGPPDDDAVGSLFHHPEIEIGIGLLVGCEAPVAPDVHHGSRDGQIILLDIPDEVPNTAMVAAPKFLIDVVGAGVKRVQRARADAPGTDACTIVCEP